VLLGDGESAEGSVWEAAEFASYYKLDNMVGIIDVNGLGQSQQTMYGHHTDVYRRRFEAFGWHALSIDGHNMDQIVDALDEAAGIKDKPTMIVASTIKGKGISFIQDLNGWHGKALKKGEEADRALAELRSNDLSTDGLKMYPPTGRTANQVIEAASAVNAKVDVGEHYKIGESVATREAYGEALARLGARNPLVVALDGDVKNSTFAEKFLNAFPDRYFECFIAEQNMVGTAAGLSAMGKIPFASSFACFLTRAFDQIRMAAISLANLKLCGSHAGVSIGEDGPSQMALEDLAMMRAIETATVLYPSDAVSTEYAVQLSAATHGIFYIRSSRPKTPVIYKTDDRFEIGKCKVIRSSKDDRTTVVAGGVTLFEALKAYDELKGQGILIRVVDIFSVKPVDAAALRTAARETGGLILTVEDHSHGGIGDAVAAAVSQDGIRVRQLLVDELPRSGKPEELLKAYGIDSSAIVSAVKLLVAAS
jgi:transketolase